MSLHLEQSYSSLPDRFFHRANLTPVKAPALMCLNERLGAELGLDLAYLKTLEGIALLAGNHRPHGIQPIALAYAGHQFGHFVPQLGDGRALLLGEIIDTKGKRHDLQLKGSGPTIFSRTGDGRAALGPVLREYIISEAMAALDIPTTRSLAVVQTGETVLRDRPLPGAILARVASSHIRIGTFQYFAIRGDVEALRRLSQYVMQRHYPEALQNSFPYLALLESVLAAQASLIAKWMSVGFIQGVMNTDNMSITGETIDYGPCAFMDSFDPATCFSSIDRDGRYAYGHQPAIALWNLTRFAETLLPLLSDNIDNATMIAEKALLLFEPLYAEASTSLMRGKIGLELIEEGDADLIKDLLDVMAVQKADFTLTFRVLGQAVMEEKGVRALDALVKNPEAFEPWLLRWRQRLSREPQSPTLKRDRMNKINPVYIPRNHQVEDALDAAVNNQDFDPFNKLLRVLENPFSEKQGYSSYAAPPEPQERMYQTFCGT
jgi:uncharacterized protein YdiU (UPF0061 family)